MVQKIGLDKSSPYKNGGFLPLFNIFVGANGRSPLPFEPCQIFIPGVVKICP